MEKAVGHYLGTEIDEKWWRRYMRGGFLARGVGKYWMDDTALHFLRDLTKVPLQIPFSAMRAVKTGKFHAGRWNLGRPIVKVLWEHEGQRLSSGFVISSDEAKVQAFMEQLSRKIL